MQTLVERYRKEIEGVLSCFDRVVIQGTLPNFNHAEGMTSYLCSQGIRIFDYNQFAEGLRDRVRENAERTAREAGLEIEFVRKAHVRKEDIVAAAACDRAYHWTLRSGSPQRRIGNGAPESRPAAWTSTTILLPEEY